MKKRVYLVILHITHVEEQIQDWKAENQEQSSQIKSVNIHSEFKEEEDQRKSMFQIESNYKPNYF